MPLTMNDVIKVTESLPALARLLDTFEDPSIFQETLQVIEDSTARFDTEDAANVLKALAKQLPHLKDLTDRGREVATQLRRIAGVINDGDREEKLCAAAIENPKIVINAIKHGVHPLPGLVCLSHDFLIVRGSGALIKEAGHIDVYEGNNYNFVGELGQTRNARFSNIGSLKKSNIQTMLGVSGLFESLANKSMTPDVAAPLIQEITNGVVVFPKAPAAAPVA